MLNKKNQHVNLRKTQHNKIENILFKCYTTEQIDQRTEIVYSLPIVLLIWSLAFEHVPDFVAFGVHSFDYVSIPYNII